MDLTFQVPMQYCSLQHRTLLSPLGSPTSQCHFCFGPATSFLLSLLVIALCFSPVAYWTPSDLGGSSSGVVSFCLFMLFMGSSWWEYWSDLPFPPPVTTFCQNSVLWPVHLGWSYPARLIALLSYPSPFAVTRLWSMKGYFGDSLTDHPFSLPLFIHIRILADNTECGRSDWNRNKPDKVNFKMCSPEMPCQWSGTPELFLQLLGVHFMVMSLML